jgi:hypothetical protein
MKPVAKAHTRLLGAVAALCVVVAGCASNPPSPPSAPSAWTPARPIEPASHSTALLPATAPLGDPCNVRSGEVKVGAQMIERGAALVFTTSDDVHNLRKRATDLTVLAPLRPLQPRSDNVRGGVRLVFEAQTAGDLTTVQRVVHEQAREIAKTCGMVLAAPGEQAAEQRREESSSRAADSFAASKASQNTPAVRDNQKEPEADKSDSTKPPAKAEAKPEPAKQPKPENEPKDSDKPKDDKNPKGDEKPPVPSLPGPRPDPIAPD